MSTIDTKSMRNLTYGLFALFTNDGVRDNACIINTAQQITTEPNRITIAVNQSNYSCEVIKKTGIFNFSILTEKAPFDIFTRFGFQSGRDTDKLAGFDEVATSDNGLKFLTEYANCFISAKVIASTDYGTHTLFVAEVTEAAVINSDPSVTYAYYFANIKPKPKAEEPKAEEKKIVGWVCTICGYEYEGAELPADYVCPLCKHPASDFEPIYG